jgi:hypothetical protein
LSSFVKFSHVLVWCSKKNLATMKHKPFFNRHENPFEKPSSGIDELVPWVHVAVVVRPLEWRLRAADDLHAVEGDVDRARRNWKISNFQSKQNVLFQRG